MPDDRFFHKRAGHSEKVNTLTDFEELIWRYYVLSSDDFGVMRFDHRQIQNDHERAGNRPAKAIQKALERIAAVGLVHTFEHQGRPYCYSRNWQRYQKIDYPRETQHPCPPDVELAHCEPDTHLLFLTHPGGKVGRDKKLRLKAEGIDVDSLPILRMNPESVGQDLRFTRVGALAQAQAQAQAQAEGSGNGEGHRAHVVCADDLLSQDARLITIVEVVTSVAPEQRADAREFQRVVESRLKSAGLSIRREVEITWRDGRSGFIDLLADGTPQIAIELDNRTGRAKSIAKLLAYEGYRVLVVRDGYSYSPQPIGGIDLLISCAPLPPALAGRVERDGTTLPARAGAFCEWYATEHERLIGVGYIGNPRKDYESALQLCEKLSDAELRDAATVWFGMSDNFAVNGTRTVTKFASRASHCVQIARRTA